MDAERRRIAPVWRANVERDERLIIELRADREARMRQLDLMAAGAGDSRLIGLAWVRVVERAQSVVGAWAIENWISHRTPEFGVAGAVSHTASSVIDSTVTLVSRRMGVRYGVSMGDSEAGRVARTGNSSRC